MCFPPGADLILVTPNEPERGRDATRAQTVVLGQLDIRVEPELRFPGGMLNFKDKTKEQPAFGRSAFTPGFTSGVLSGDPDRIDSHGYETLSGSY